MELERQLVTVPIDYLTVDDLLTLMDHLFKDAQIELISDPLTIKFVGGPLVSSPTVSIAIEYYHEMNPEIEFIIATGPPINGDEVLKYQSQTIDKITFDYDTDIPEVPDSKIKILAKFLFTRGEESFWKHANGHMISLVKVTQCNEQFLTEYLQSLTETGDK